MAASGSAPSTGGGAAERSPGLFCPATGTQKYSPVFLFLPRMTMLFRTRRVGEAVVVEAVLETPPCC